MLTFIGDPDSELRDSIICNLFYAGIPSGQVSIKQQQWLLNQILDKNLVMTGIDQDEGDLVFTRTFSLLVLALIVSEDSKLRFISEAQLKTIFKLANTYLRMEHDTRGYVIDKGWAHGIAHGADLLVSVLFHPSFSQAMIPGIHQTIETIVFRKTEPFIANEESRLGQVIVAQLTRYPESAELLITWLKEMGVRLSLAKGQSNNFETYQLERKLNQFIESLYFQTVNQDQNLSEQLLTLILFKA